jgi:hypothetical protein
MKLITTYMIIGLLVITSLLLAACSATNTAAEKIKPAEIIKIDGSEFSKVVLTEKAAERLGIETAIVRDEVIDRARTVAGEVVNPQAVSGKLAIPPGKALVKVYVNKNDSQQVDLEENAQVMSMDDEDGDGLEAEIADDIEDSDLDDSEDPPLYYYATDSGKSLTPGQKVLVDLTLQGSGIQQKVIPYEAVIYGIHGETWVYTNPEPLVFIRQPIVIDFIDENMVVLSNGPATGSKVVTVGVAELFGAETGVSK